MSGPIRGGLIALALAGSLTGCGGDVTPTAVPGAPTPLALPATATTAAALPTTTTVAELPPTEPPRPTKISRPHTPTAGAPTTTSIVLATLPPAPTTTPIAAEATPASADVNPPVPTTSVPSAPGPTLPPEVADWPKYSGPWFDIQYPPGFKARAGGQPDSAYFTSPDGAVEFYVFSPQWNGDISEIEINPAKETVVEDVTQFAPSLDDPKAIHKHWVTVRAKDGSYTRAYYDEENTLLNTRYAFGIKYKTQADYTRYRPQYLLFKQTLVQYAD